MKVRPHEGLPQMKVKDACTGAERMKARPLPEHATIKEMGLVVPPN